MKRKIRNYMTRLLFSLFIILNCGLFIPDSVCFSQQGSQKSIALKTYRFDAASFKQTDYGIIRIKDFKDLDDETYNLNPSRLSRLRALQVIGGSGGGAIFTPRIGLGPPSGYHINFTELNGGARLKSLYVVGTITMEGVTPDWNDPPIAGKHVYDIAESMRTKEADIADVVVISEKEELTVTRSAYKFDTKVAGVISGNPKLLLGGNGIPENKAVALAGIVACKVTAENGPIQKGDLLVTSSLPGHAMRAGIKEIMPGMVVGMALEPLNSRTGKINILVN